MSINNKVKAIQAIRALRVELINFTLDSGHTVQRVMIGPLAEIKNIVESVMAFSREDSIVEEQTRTLRNELHEAHEELMSLRMELENMKEDIEEFDRIKGLLSEEKARNARLMNRLQAVHVALED